MSTLVWFRHDLRLQDNAALMLAIARGAPVIPVFIWDCQAEGKWAPGAASRWWLHHSLTSLDTALRARGSRLLIACGPTVPTLRRLVKDTDATAVYWNRRYEPAARAVEAEVTEALANLETRGCAGALLFDPAVVRNKTGNPFQVFTPFWRHCLTLEVPAPLTLPRAAWRQPARWPASLKVSALKLLPTIHWDEGIAATWRPGEEAAQKQLRIFVRGGMSEYASGRDCPATAGTSRLSPHLHFGEISPRQVWAAVRAEGKTQGVFPPNRGAQVFLSEIGWREFAHHLLFHFSRTPDESLRPEFKAFPWRRDAEQLSAWQRGRTGYPIVDAGMRELWSTGWMHNRVRMIVASLLVKHLRLSWQAGAAWFWDTLVDADLANNTLGWQWSAGCGADAAPYFRIFNPVLQGEKFDPEGAYVRRWVPELAKVPPKFIHQPWAAPADLLAKSGVTLGETYPKPQVDHAEARAAALGAFKAMRAGRG